MPYGAQKIRRKSTSGRLIFIYRFPIQIGKFGLVAHARVRMGTFHFIPDAHMEFQLE